MMFFTEHYIIARNIIMRSITSLTKKVLPLKGRTFLFQNNYAMYFALSSAALAM